MTLPQKTSETTEGSKDVPRASQRRSRPNVHFSADEKLGQTEAVPFEIRGKLGEKRADLPKSGSQGDQCEANGAAPL